MSYTLKQAAEATGKSIMTIQRAIKKGKISAEKGDNNRYSIEASELHRVFPAISVDTSQSDKKLQNDITSNNSMLQAELKSIREKYDNLKSERENERDMLVDQIEDLRKRLDSESEERKKLTLMITDQSHQQRKKIFGIF